MICIIPVSYTHLLHIKSDDRSEYREGGEDIAGEYGADGSK